MNLTAPALGCAIQEFQVGQAVFVIEETVLAVVAALCNVLRDTREIEPARSWHDRTPEVKS